MMLSIYLARLDHDNRHVSNDLLGHERLLLNVSRSNGDHAEVLTV
jgi:hypothetical protein